MGQSPQRMPPCIAVDGSIWVEGGLGRIAEAKGAIERKDIAAKCTAISKALGIIGGLCEGLDLENSADSVGDLNQLYIYMMKRLAEANVKSDPQILDEVAGLLRTVKEGWDGIAPPGPQF